MNTTELDIERMSYGVAAVGRFTPAGEARPVVVFVEGAVPGDRVRVQLVKWHGNYWEGELLEILKPSEHRVEPPCPVFGKCGGCQWQHLDYDFQVQSKKEILLHQLRRIAPNIESQIEVHAAPSPWGYRNRIQVRGDANGLGFFAKKSHELVHVDKCAVTSPEIQEIWQNFVQTRPMKELAGKKGQFKIEWVRTAPGQVLEAINREHAALGFTQINGAQNQVLVDLVKRLVSPTADAGVLFDLYGGDGNLSSGLRGQFKNILCVEAFGSGRNPTEVASAGLFSASKTDSDAHLGNYVHVRCDVAKFLRDRHWIDWGLSNPDCVIADPPRSGMKDTLPHLLTLNPSRLVLVSCDPSTLARDLGALLPFYKISEIHFIDMFPQTYHIESVVCLVRNEIAQPS